MQSRGKFISKKWLSLSLWIGLILFLNPKPSRSQQVIDSCFTSVNNSTNFVSSPYIQNLSVVQSDMLSFLNGNWWGDWPNANITLPPPNNLAGCKSIWIGSDLWTTGGEGFGLKLDTGLVPGVNYTFTFQYVSHGIYSDGNFSPFFYTGTSPSLQYFVGNLPPVGYNWTTNSISFTASLAQANHNWIILTTYLTGSSGMITNFCTTCGFSLENDCNVHLGNDVSICQGDTLTLDVTKPGASYLWSDQSTNSSINITQQGWYSVTVNSPGCTDTDSIYVTVMSGFDPSLSIAIEDCSDTGVVLSSPYIGVNYLWSTGETSPIIFAQVPGSYTVTSYLDNCSITDTISIKENPCIQIIEMPNVFSPNEDGKNDAFVPTKIGGIEQAELLIFNRWGQLIYSTSNLIEGWNGMANGENCPDGVYFWLLQARFYDKEIINQKGTVTLIR